MDDFRVIRLDGEPVLLCKIAPAISPIFGNNPGYQVYQYDRESGALENYQTYYLTDLDSRAGSRRRPRPAGGPSSTTSARPTAWTPRPPGTVDRLADRIRTDAAVRRNYTTFYGVSAAPEITPQTLDVYRCAITNVTPAEFLTCLSGTPKPKRPPAFPDRRPAAGPAPRRDLERDDRTSRPEPNPMETLRHPPDPNPGPACSAARWRLLLVGVPGAGPIDPLPSWNDGPARKAILDFVRAATDPAGPDFVPPEERIATFDNDGTLWVEQPIYTQVEFAFDRVKALAPGHPEWKTEEPFRSILAGDREAMAQFTHPGLRARRRRDPQRDDGGRVPGDRQGVARHGASTRAIKRPYTELVYQPMLELMRYLRANGFKTYIVTGGGQDFVRAFAESVYGVPPEQVIGSAGKVKYEYDRDGKPVLVKLPERAPDRRRGGQARGDQPGHRPPAPRGLRQLDRRSADARMDPGRRRRRG